jgi:hypothetical protein
MSVRRIITGAIIVLGIVCAACQLPTGGNVRYDYFLLTDPSGIDGDHARTDERPERRIPPDDILSVGYPRR